MCSYLSRIVLMKQRELPHSRPRRVRCRAMSLDGARLFHVNAKLLGSRNGRGASIPTGSGSRSARTPRRKSRSRAPRSDSTARGGRVDPARPKSYEGGAIDLLQWHEPTPVGNAPTSLVENGFQRLGVGVPDLDATIDASANSAATSGANRSHTRSKRRRRDPARRDQRPGRHRDRARSKAVRPRCRSSAITCTDLDAFLRLLPGARLPRGRATIPARMPTVHTSASTARSQWTKWCSAAPGGGDVLLMLVGLPHTAMRHGDRTARGEHARHVARAFLVADLDAAVADLARQRIATISPPVDDGDGTRTPDAAFRLLSRTRRRSPRTDRTTAN